MKKREEGRKTVKKREKGRKRQKNGEGRRKERRATADGSKRGTSTYVSSLLVSFQVFYIFFLMEIVQTKKVERREREGRREIAQQAYAYTTKQLMPKRSEDKDLFSLSFCLSSSVPYLLFLMKIV